MSETLEIRRKRLRFRSWHRGTKEMDLLLGSFADRHLEAMSADQLERYEALLELPDPQIYLWLLDRAEPPPDFDHDLMTLLRNFKFKSEQS